jgi:hypothetical protein
MKICLYSSQLEPLVILDAPSNLRAGQRIRVNCQTESAHTVCAAANQPPTEQMVFAVAEVKVLHMPNQKAALIAVNHEISDDATIVTQCTNQWPMFIST